MNVVCICVYLILFWWFHFLLLFFFCSLAHSLAFLMRMCIFGKYFSNLINNRWNGDLPLNIIRYSISHGCWVLTHALTLANIIIHKFLHFKIMELKLSEHNVSFNLFSLRTSAIARCRCSGRDLLFYVYPFLSIVANDTKPKQNDTFQCYRVVYIQTQNVQSHFG